MVMEYTVFVTKLKEDFEYPDLEVKVDCWLMPGSKGSRDEYGVPLEPDFPPHVDDYLPKEVRYYDGEIGGFTEWKDYDDFVEKHGIELEFDTAELTEKCLDNLDHPPI